MGCFACMSHAIGCFCLLIYFSVEVLLIYVMSDPSLMKLTSSIDPGYVIAFLVVILLINTFKIAITFLMMYGIAKKRHKLMTPWLIVTLIDLILTALAVFAGVFVGGVHYTVVILFVLFIIIWFIVFWVYRGIKREAQGRQ